MDLRIPHFDVAWHLRRVDVPEPHGRDEVLAFAALAAMSGFDRTCPLWEFTLVEGLEDGRSAVIMKMHHSLTDGIGGCSSRLALFDADAEGDHEAGGPVPAAPPGEWVRGHRLVLEALADRATRLRDGAVAAVQLVPGARPESHAIQWAPAPTSSRRRVPSGAPCDPSPPCCRRS